MKKKKLIKKLEAFCKEVDTGEFSSKSKDFGRGVTFSAEQIRAIVKEAKRG